MLIKFKEWHLKDTRWTDPWLRDLIGKYPIIKNANDLAKRGFIYTIITEKNPIILGIVGAIPLNEKTCEVFVFKALGSSSHCIEFVKSICKILKEAKIRFDKIQAVSKDAASACRLLEWLGFKQMGTVKRGEEMILWRLA